MIDRCRSIIRLALRHDNNMIQQHDRVVTLRHKHVRGDDVAGVQFAKDARILQLVGHRHRIHKAGNGVVIQCHFPGRRIGRDYLAAQMVRLEGRSGRLRGRRRNGTASASRDRRKNEQQKESANHTPVYNSGAALAVGPAAQRITQAWSLGRAWRLTSG